MLIHADECHGYRVLQMQPGSLEKRQKHASNTLEGQMVTGVKWTQLIWSHTKRHFHSHSDVLGEAELQLPGETLVMLNKGMLKETQRCNSAWRDFELPEAHTVRVQHALQVLGCRGAGGRCLLLLSPLPSGTTGCSTARRCSQWPWARRAPACLPRELWATSTFSVDCQTRGMPTPTEQSWPLSTTWILFLFLFKGLFRA